jgi:Zn-dependent membrane protease YugP
VATDIAATRGRLVERRPHTHIPTGKWRERGAVVLVVLGGLLLLALVFAPALWARAVLRWYRDDRPDFPGTGGELARHLLDEAGLGHVPVEPTERGDHYDPDAKAVRLSPAHFDGRSLVAVVVAAHEVAHALQDRDGYAPLAWRGRLARLAYGVELVGSGLVYGGLALAALAKSPALVAAAFGVGVLSRLAMVTVHAVTLPVEWNASFARALPILDGGDYVPKSDLGAARRILRACALTYVATSLVSLLNLWRWLRFMR